MKVKIDKICPVDILIDLAKNLDKMIRSFEIFILVKVRHELSSDRFPFRVKKISICQFGN